MGIILYTGTELRKIRLCLLADGPNVHTVKWASHFVNRGYHVSLISFKETTIEGVDFHSIQRKTPIVIDHNASVFRKVGYMAYPQIIKKMICSIRPDILHAHWATSYGLMGAISNFHPFIVSAWGRDVYKASNSIVYSTILKYVFRKADYITTTSEHLLNAAKAYVLNPKKSVIQIPFGVDINQFKPKRKSNSRILNIGYIKKLEPYYGCEYLINAFSKISRKYPFLKLHIIGDGSEKEKLRKMTTDYRLDNTVTFYGEIRHDQIINYYQKMDIVVIPSIVESFGVVALEASACGIPVIASDIQGLRETVFDNKTGFLVPPQNIEILIEKLEILINDKDLRRMLGSGGRRVVETQYSWEMNAVKMEDLYLKCMHHMNV